MTKKIVKGEYQYPIQYPGVSASVLGYYSRSAKQILKETYMPGGGMLDVHTLIYPRKDKIRADGRCSLYLRVTIAREISQISLNIFVLPERWSKAKQELAGKDEETRVLNNLIFAIKSSLFKLCTKLTMNEEKVSAADFIKQWMHREVKPVDFITWMEDKVHSQWDSDQIEYNTYRHRDYVIRLLRSFKPSIAFNEMTPDLIRDFQKYDRRQIAINKQGKKMVRDGENTVTKHCKTIRIYVRLAMKTIPPLITKDPFDEIRMPERHTEKKPLSIEQLKALWAIYEAPDYDRMLHKGYLFVFLFQCHTGLRISDLKSLHRSEIMEVQHQGQSVMVIKKVPKKTARYDKDIMIPLQSMFIGHVKSQTGYIFENMREATYNQELKKIGMCVGFEGLSSHNARHTFATINLYLNNNPMVTMNMLGHSRLDTTAVYNHQVIGQHIDAVRKMELLIKESGHPDGQPL